MSQHWVVCTTQTGCSHDGHITGVGTGVPNAPSVSWTVREVYASIDRGNTFYTYANGRMATVRPYDCPCGRGSLRSSPDATTANNLDNLDLCPWRAA